jgi:hypothetical protein
MEHYPLFCEECTQANALKILARFWSLSEALYHLTLHPTHTIRVAAEPK